MLKSLKRVVLFLPLVGLISFGNLVFGDLVIAEPKSQGDQEFERILKSVREKRNTQSQTYSEQPIRTNIPRAKPAPVRPPMRETRVAQVSGGSHSALDSTQEDWKGEEELNQFEVGAIVGLGFEGSTGGFALYGHFAYKILHEGLIPDINDQVYLEAQLGPLFLDGPADSFVHTLRARWDFHRDYEQGLYALAGLGGSALSGSYRMFPYFGAGGFFKINEQIRIRAEISHNLIGVGGSFLF